MKDASAEILDGIPAGVAPFRVAICHRVRGHGVDQVKLLQEPVTNRAFFGGLMKCASVWVCPVCAATITERRREELTRANASAYEKRIRVFMLTLTAPHKMGDDLKKLLQGIRDARRVMFNRKGWKRAKDAAGIVGTICALEVTHGGNGWHVHVHELVYCQGEGAALDAAELLPLWQSACAAAGLGRPNEHGLKVGDGSKAAAYVAKFGAEDRGEDGWSIEHEMTKAHVKRGKKGGRSPWDLLRAFADTGKERDAELFRFYAIAFRGRRQLVWSRGLRELLGVLAKSDEALVEENREEAKEIWSFDQAEWRWIIERGLQGVVLQAARERGKAGVYSVLYPDG
jgi:replication protein